MSIQGKDREQKDNDAYSRNFARIPNMLFVSFKHLSKEEKFLYCTLKSVYWDAKPRYVSLRELSDLTGYSRSALGSMLPRLDSCGLVHAEIRKERDKHGVEIGNAKYNITILDIWELNKQYHSCPPERQDLLDPSLILVRESCQACPPNKPGLSVKAAKPVRENVQVRARPERAKKDKDFLKTSFKEEDALLSSPALSVWTKWCEAQGYIVTRKWTKREQEHCIALVEMGLDLTPKLMNEVREWAQEEQPFLRNRWGLKNLINALPDYFKQAPLGASQQPEEIPMLTEEEANESVLWTDHSDGAYAFCGSIEQMTRAGILKRMSRSSARLNGYDMPGAYHFDAQEEAEYDAVQATMSRRAG